MATAQQKDSVTPTGNSHPATDYIPPWPTNHLSIVDPPTRSSTSQIPGLLTTPTTVRQALLFIKTLYLQFTQHFESTLVAEEVNLFHQGGVNFYFDVSPSDIALSLTANWPLTALSSSDQ
jgi:hypothetical protein